eukprot:3953417-Pyramimonas_sp.AAC.1
MQFGLAKAAKARYSDGGGAFNNDAAKAALEAEGIELRIRARGQRATSIAARNGIIRRPLPSWRRISTS